MPSTTIHSHFLFISFMLTPKRVGPGQSHLKVAPTESNSLSGVQTYSVTRYLKGGMQNKDRLVIKQRSFMSMALKIEECSIFLMHAEQNVCLTLASYWQINLTTRQRISPRHFFPFLMRHQSIVGNFTFSRCLRRVLYIRNTGYFKGLPQSFCDSSAFCCAWP